MTKRIRSVGRSRVRVTIALIASTVLIAACGSDDDATSTAESTDASSAESVLTGVTTQPDDTQLDSTPSDDTQSVSSQPEETASGPAPTTVPADDAVSGGSLTFLNQTETGTLDPAKMGITVTATRGDGLVLFAIFGGLVLDDPVSGEVDMLLAESLTSDDGSVWTLKLRPDLVFSDGTPFDAEAVKLNWERHAAPDSTSAAAGSARAMTAIEVVDPLTVEITLAAPNGQFPRTLALYGINFIASPESWLSGNPDESPIGAGPFVLEEFVRDDHMTLARNPLYFDAPRPYLDELIVRPIPDGQQRWNALQTGQGQVAHNSVDFELIANAEEAGYGTYLTPLSGASIFLLNNSRPPFDDLRMRQAIQLGLDVDELNRLVQRDRADVAKTIAAEGTPFFDSELTLPEPDPAEAQRLIDEVVAENGGPVTFTILTNTQNLANAEGIQTLLSQFDGLEVQIQTVASVSPDITSGNYDMGISGLFFIDPEPRMFDRLKTGLPSNWARYSNPDVDAALDTARASQDLAERQAAYKVVQQAIIDDAPFITLWRIPSTLMFDETLQQVSTFGDGVLRIDEVWLAE
jgi:peptide/nickel transport system substrate-binding protein